MDEVSATEPVTFCAMVIHILGMPPMPSIIPFIMPIPGPPAFSSFTLSSFTWLS